MKVLLGHGGKESHNFNDDDKTAVSFTSPASQRDIQLESVWQASAVWSESKPIDHYQSRDAKDEIHQAQDHILPRQAEALP